MAFISAIYYKDFKQINSLNSQQTNEGNTIIILHFTNKETKP